MKGCPRSRVKKEVKDMISELSLQEKRKAPSKELSAGVRRKLCVGIALIAGSKACIAAVLVVSYRTETASVVSML